MDPSEPITPSPSPALSEVSWQTIFWTLVPLAISVMTQPCGRICSNPSRYRTYLRSSPIICAADAFSILIRLGLCSSLLIPPWLSWKESVRVVMDERFNDIGEHETSTEGIQALEKMTWLRWLFFVLGTLGPAVKLMALGGIPWSKAWGIMFLCSFIMVECLVVLSWSSQYKPIPTFEDDTLLKLKNVLSSIDYWVFCIACALHIGLLLSIVSDLWPMPSSNFLCYDYSSVDPVAKLWFRILTLTAELLYIFMACCFCFFLYPMGDRGAASDRSGALVIRVYIVLCEVDVAVLLWFFPGYKWFLVDILFTIFLFVPFYALSFSAPRLFKRFPNLVRNLLVNSHVEGWRLRWNDFMDQGDFWCFLNLFYSLLLYVLWYSLRYDSKGTVNPSWTSVWGRR